MSGNDEYRFDGDSDEEKGMSEKQNAPKIVTIEDLEVLKAQTTDLLDPSWKISRNKKLINKMLELEEPVITDKMVDFLLQEDTCAALINFITQANTDDNLKRPSPVDPHTPEIKLAYKTMLLITSEEPTEGLLDFLKQRATLVAKLILNIFQDTAAGSFFHVYRVYELLCRYYPDNVYEAMCAEGKCEQRVTQMLRYIGYAPISELIVMMIGIAPIPRTSVLYTNCESNRKKFMNVLADWSFLKKVAGIIINPAANCYVGAYVDAESHSFYATLLLQDLIEKLSAEDIGQRLLESLTNEPSLLDMLVGTVVDSNASEYKRHNSAKILYFLLRRAADEEMTTNIGMKPNAMAPNYTANRLNKQREKLIKIVGKHLPVIIERLVTFNVADVRSKDPASMYKIPPGPILFTSFKVKEPFTTLRTSLVELLVILVESNERMADHVTAGVWKTLFEWCMSYANNTVFHTLFYRLIFAVLRQRQEAHHRNLFQAGKFLQFLSESFLALPFRMTDSGQLVAPGDTAGQEYFEPPKKASEEVKSKFVIRCLVMNCAHAVRLQSASQNPHSFLPSYLKDNAHWGALFPQLIAAMENQHRYGLGIQVTYFKASHNSSALMGIVGEEPQIDREGGIGHGSNFAKNLGFTEEAPWEDGDSSDVNVSMHSDDAAADGERLSEGRSPGSVKVDGGSGFLSPSNTNRLSLQSRTSLHVFDKDSQEDADIIDGITSPMDAMDVLERRRESIGQDDSPARKSQVEEKMSPHERKQLFSMDDSETGADTAATASISAAESEGSDAIKAFLQSELASQSQSDNISLDLPDIAVELRESAQEQQQETEKSEDK